ESVAPTITSPDSITVAENQTSVIDVNATDDIDAEGAGLSYTITGGADAALFSIDPLTGIVSFNDAPDFEAPADSNTDNIYELTIAVENSAALSSTQNITVTVNDVDDISGFPIRIEAESASNVVNYRLENIGVASGGQVLSFRGFPGNESGSATFEFNGVSDSYNILLATFDENDGVASFTAELNDFETGVITEIGSLDLNQNLGSRLANATTFITPTVASNIALTPGDTIVINGFEQGSEHARLDYIDFIPVI
ncbi:MAG: cadherin repeat domain-containing protein, partial [Cyanobacteria bacterium P01_C01_bin.121]